jgi:hypothetical protein
MNTFRLGAIALICSIIFTACEKQEQPITLPPKGDAEIVQIDLGETYARQVYFDLESGQVVHSSDVNSWDLALEAGANGKHVFINGGKDMFVYNTHSTNISEVNKAPLNSDKVWKVDDPSGLPDQTCIGEWQGKNEVYIVRINPSLYRDSFAKLVLTYVDANEYRLMYSPLREKIAKTVTIKKQPGQNYVYFSFTTGEEVRNCEPISNTNWDIVFTRYRYLYKELDNYPYLVTGALLNPYKTQAVKDSMSFSELKSEYIATAKFSPNRDVIGFDWKSYDIDAGKYTTYPEMVYVIENGRKGDGMPKNYYKLHFLDYYSASGVKGSPKLEFQRLQ